MAVLWNGANPALAFAWRDTQDAARALGITIQPQEVRDPKDIEAAIAMMAQQRPDALIVLQDALTLQHRERSSISICKSGCQACSWQRNGWRPEV